MRLFGFENEETFDSLIWQAAKTYSLDPLLIKAVIAQESGYNPSAYRAEPQIGDASRGLMQVLYKTAVWLGMRGDPDQLFDAATCITYGSKYLDYQWRRYASSSSRLDDTIAAYNAGTAKRTADGVYTNAVYVASVRHYYDGYHAVQDIPPDLPAEGPPVVETALPQEPPTTPTTLTSWLGDLWAGIVGAGSAETPTPPALVPDTPTAPPLFAFVSSSFTGEAPASDASPETGAGSGGGWEWAAAVGVVVLAGALALRGR
jgi:hypothetical protein